MNMTALLSDWYPLGQGSHAKSEFDMLEVSRNPLRLMTSLPESDTPKIYFVHLMQGNVPKCALVALQSIQTKSDSECHMLMLIVKFNSAHTCKQEFYLYQYHPQPPPSAVLAYLKIIHHSKDPLAYVWPGCLKL